MPELDVLVSVVSQKRGISPFKYITITTRSEFELDVTGWLSAIFYPIGEIAKGFSGDEKPSSKPSQAVSGPGPANEKHDDESIRRSRKSSSPYAWYNKKSDGGYKVFNLDALDQSEYRQTVGVIQKQMSEMGNK